MDWPPEMFHESYRLAAEQGYRLTAHAGMPCSSEEITKDRRRSGES